MLMWRRLWLLLWGVSHQLIRVLLLMIGLHAYLMMVMWNVVGMMLVANMLLLLLLLLLWWWWMLLMLRINWRQHGMSTGKLMIDVVAVKIETKPF